VDRRERCGAWWAAHGDVLLHEVLVDDAVLDIEGRPDGLTRPYRYCTFRREMVPPAAASTARPER
jgi:hypothetical protein